MDAMELHQIRYFLAICEHGGFSRAAQDCGVSQPALTTAVKKLEQEVSGESYVDRLSCEFCDQVMALCKERKIELYANFRSEREEWVQNMVQAGLGFAFMPEYSVTLPGVLARPLVDPAVQRDVLAVEVRGRPRAPAAKLFVESVVRDTAGGKPPR